MTLTYPVIATGPAHEGGSVSDFWHVRDACLTPTAPYTCCPGLSLTVLQLKAWPRRGPSGL